MATNLEDKLISAVLKDAQIHVLLQADATKLFRTHGDVWEFVRKYYEQNQVVPTVNLVKEKFIDFEPQVESRCNQAPPGRVASGLPTGQPTQHSPHSSNIRAGG